MSIVVVATISPKPDHTDAVAAAFAEIIPQVHAEDGCELYALHRAGDQLIMIERWASEEALAMHSRGAALAALNPALRGKLTGPAQIVVSHPLPAGDPAKGQL
ncbi:MAG TPA: putative quinol monooxygenase [Streptosporangiaceae bacterium]|jgi:quinol monooxygenase YgiN|nr:putative quinol monooxygenase [Streptosporangiaceae bacterium]